MIIENDDAFALAEPNLVVASCKRDSWSVRFEMESPDVRWMLAIGGVFSVTQSPDQERASTPSIPDLVGESVFSLRARKADGELEIRFTHDWVLTVPSDPDYEAWEMYSTRGERLIAVPGDGVAKWGPSAS